MPRLYRKRSKKSGLAPGTLVHVGERKIEKPRVTVIEYDEAHYEEKELLDYDRQYACQAGDGVHTWVSVDGIHQTDLVEKIGACFGLHPLTLEDIVNTEQRPKMEDYGEYLYVVVKMIDFNDAENRLESDQISLIVRRNEVISFQEVETDIFKPVRDRMKQGMGKARRMGSDYLAYTLLDAVVDHYFVSLESIGEKIEALQEELVASPSKATLQRIHELKHQMIYVRRSVWPLRETVNALTRGESQIVSPSTLVYLRDVYDHTIQVIETIETFRDMLSGMVDIYLSSISNRMNEIMKVLTIIATIFIPLTFIAGVYGMNFEYMPELKSPWGYPAVLLLMACVAGGMLVYFRRRKWL